MKVLVINNYYYLRGGSERVMFEEASLLRAAGHTVIPFSMHHKKNFHSNYTKYFADAIEYESSSLFQKIRVTYNLVYSFKVRRSLERLLDMEQPEIIHAHNIYGRLTTSILDAAKKRKIPVVMTLHDYKLICPSYEMFLEGRPCERCKEGRFYNCLLTRCHKGNLAASVIYTIESYFNRLLKKYNYIKYFICPSKFLLKKHLEAGIPEKKLVHLPNFIKLDLFEPIFKNNGYIIYAGRLSREKGVMTLLKSIRGLEASLKIVGEGPMRVKYEIYAKENQIRNVSFEGYKTGGELKEIFKNAAFTVLPSEWYENAPMTVLESFAYGKPVIASNIGGIPEMVVDGETGLLFKPQNHEELREKIEYLINNPSKIIEFGKSARKKVEKEFNAELHYKRLMELYEKALN